MISQNDLVQVTSSPPARRRGLKLDDLGQEPVQRGLASRAEAWIETLLAQVTAEVELHSPPARRRGLNPLVLTER